MTAYVSRAPAKKRWAIFSVSTAGTRHVVLRIPGWYFQVTMTTIRVKNAQA